MKNLILGIENLLVGLLFKRISIFRPKGNFFCAVGDSKSLEFVFWEAKNDRQNRNLVVILLV